MLAFEPGPPSVQEENARSLALELGDYIDALEAEVKKAIADAAALTTHLSAGAREHRLSEAAMKERAAVRRRSDQKRWQDLL